ncbi:hypothetical protein A5662_17205 [Mycobacteriaceae bacterium 1482268.1]|nr:hypothetical protein A5662_17205 [Mycobacteriaceae bacterium 1482268.1]
MTVSISDRAFDVHEPTQPATVCTLLRELGMTHSCVEQQKTALRAWLTVHEPERPLRISLCENGYGLVLKETDFKRHR